MIVPAFTGLGSPYWDPYARGTIVGISRGHDPGPPGPAPSSRRWRTRPATSSRRWRRGAGPAVTSLRVDGGAAVMDLLLQLQADQLGVAVSRARHQETTALGAAYLAGLAEGVWGSLDEIAALWQLGRARSTRARTAPPPTPPTRPGAAPSTGPAGGLPPVLTSRNAP